MTTAPATTPPVPPHALRVAVVTPEGAVHQGPAETVVVPAHDGEVAFLPGHAPFVGSLGAGELRVRSTEGTKRWFLEGGVVQVLDGVVTVLAEATRPIDSLDAAEAKRDLEAALAEHPTTDAAFAERDRRTASARARLRLAPPPR